MITWEDSTSYSQGERRDKITPRSWRAKLGPHFTLVVTRIHGADPEKWYMNLYPVINNATELGSSELVEAQEEAKRMAQGILKGGIRELEGRRK